MSARVLISPCDPGHPEAEALRAASYALMEAHFPPESNQALGTEALRQPNVSFFGARLSPDGPILGCGGLMDCGDYGEVKSLFTAPEARGHGIGMALMDRIEAEARALNLPVLRLETGGVLEAAVRLYERCGFTTCGVYGKYTFDPLSIYMEKHLAPQPAGARTATAGRA
jgi:putative acetyltransferase